MAQSRFSNSTPTEEELNALAGRLATEQTTMTLATAGNDAAWAAPVYFVFFKSVFYFLSSRNPDTLKRLLKTAGRLRQYMPPVLPGRKSGGFK